PTTIVIVTLATSITFLTALSLAALATNMRVGGGGAYYIIARSLGVETGAAAPRRPTPRANTMLGGLTGPAGSRHRSPADGDGGASWRASRGSGSRRRGQLADEKFALLKADPRHPSLHF
ncbi:MAG TPA: hypothetical protein VF970_11880, partial [Gemmatimonadales bacterium]